MNSSFDLNETDIEILSLLSEGRETRGSLADQINKHENYIGERLKWLRTYEMIRYHHKETGLYEITNRGRETVSRF